MVFSARAATKEAARCWRRRTWTPPRFSSTLPADFSDRHDGAVAGRHDRAGNRRVIVQRQVSPCFFVVRTVQRHQLPSTGFAEHDHVIETFATRGSHKSLDEWILPGSAHRSTRTLTRSGPPRRRWGLIERVVAIMDQRARRLVPRKSFAHLLGRP